MPLFFRRWPWMRRYLIARAERLRAEQLSAYATAVKRRNTQQQHDTYRAAVRVTALALAMEAK